MTETTAGPAVGDMLIVNVGLMLSGALEQPILEADSLLVRHGNIAQIGCASALRSEAPAVVVDAQGSTLTPGLIASHVHPVFGDSTPRQHQQHWIDTMMPGGVTSMMAAGEVHVPGRARDIVGVKALAITAQRACDHVRPGGVKMQAGAPVIAPGRVEDDFQEMAEAGVQGLGEVGLGGVKQGRRGQADGGLGAPVRHPEHHAHRRTVHSGLGLD